MDERPYKCTFCKATFKFPGVLASHKYNMHKGEKLPLNGEGLDLRIYPKTSNEIVNDHLDNNKDLYDDDTFNRLKRKASGDEVPEPYNFLPKRDKPPREDPSINCSLCSATFLNERDRVIHMADFHPTCLDCRKQFASREEYDQHEHPRSQCKVCKRKFMSDEVLNDHLKTHPKCYRCDEIFLNDARLRMHVLQDHERRDHRDRRDRSRSPQPIPSSQQVRCPECSRKVERRFLDIHMEEEHGNDSEASTVSGGNEVVPYTDSEASTVSIGNEVVPYDSDISDISTVLGDSDDDAYDSDTTLSVSDEVVPYVPSDTVDDVPDLPVGVLTDEESLEPEETRISCPDCHRKFASQALLERHHRDKHQPKNKHKRPARSRSPFDGELPGPSNLKAYQCNVCKDILKTKKGYLEHMKSHRYDCNMCAARFNTVDDRDKHMSLEHPFCRICEKAFPNLDDYIRHKIRYHSEDQSYDGHLPSESEDEMNSDEDDIDVEDRQFHKHINCVSIDKFMEIRELINHNNFETLVSDEELLDALQIVFKGVIKGFIPICSSQRLVLTRPMKRLMFRFGTKPSATLLMRNKSNLKQLFNILWDSVNNVITNFMKYDR